MARRAEAKYTITAEDKTGRAFKSVNQRLNRFVSLAKKAGVALVAVFSGRALISNLQRTAKHFDDIGKAARRIGVSVGALSRLGFAAEMAGSSQDELNRAVEALSRNTVLAANGAREQNRWFTQLNLNAKEMQQLDPAARFAAVAIQLSKLEKAGTKTAVAQGLMEESGRRLIPLMEDIGAKGLREVGREAEMAGAAMTNELAEAAAKVTDEFARANAQVKALNAQLVLAAANTNAIGGVTNIGGRLVTQLNRPRTTLGSASAREGLGSTLGVFGS